MRMYPTIRALPLLPGAWIASLRSMDLDTAYGRSQRWSKRVIQWLGYRIEVKGQDQIHGIHGAYFVCNHQGTLDPVPILATCGVPLSFISKKENAHNDEIYTILKLGNGLILSGSCDNSVKIW